jgi:hypothetical protein
MLFCLALRLIIASTSLEQPLFFEATNHNDESSQPCVTWSVCVCEVGVLGDCEERPTGAAAICGQDF